MKKLIINLAPTGIKPTKEMNLNVPITIDEIVEDVYKCYKLGVQIVHLHVKDENGKNTSDKFIYEKVIKQIREKCKDIIICASLSGRNNNTFESRSAVLELEGDSKPDMGSLTLSSLNFTDGASINSPDMIIQLLEKMNKNDIKPELEVFDLGMINYSKYLIKKGLLKAPYYYNIICGNISSCQAKMDEISIMINNLPDNSIFSLGGFGFDQLKMNIYGILNADGIRIGLEDNLYIDENKNLASNESLVKRILQITSIYGRNIATCNEVRELLQINKVD
jgi:3-keto-5-aminohexanoate cleavage enzyme